MQVKHQMSAVRNFQPVWGQLLQTFLFVLLHLFEEVGQVDDDPVSQESDAVRQDDSWREKVEREVSLSNDDGVTDDVAAGATSDHVDTFRGEQVDQFSYKLITNCRYKHENVFPLKSYNVRKIANDRLTQK